MENIVLTGTVRTEFGKGAARRARRAGLVPAVVYGHEGAPLHIDLDEHDLFLVVRSQRNAVVELRLEGGTTQLAVVKEVQRHPLHRNLLHVDFLAVEANEQAEAAVEGE